MKDIEIFGVISKGLIDRKAERNYLCNGCSSTINRGVNFYIDEIYRTYFCTKQCFIKYRHNQRENLKKIYVDNDIEENIGEISVMKKRIIR